MTLVIVAAAFFLFGVACMGAGAIYYFKARVVHARTEELQAEVCRNYDNAVVGQRRAEDLLARVQEHIV
jgi:hypothetical protein